MGRRKKKARMSAPTYVSPRNYEDSEEDHFDDIGSPTMPTGSNFRDNSDEEPRPRERRQKLFNELSVALYSPSHQKYGSFASSKAIKYSHSQGLFMKSFHVEGVGELQVPLSAEDISKICGVREKAQCWEIDASKVAFLGEPEFMANTIHPLAMHAVRDLARHGAAVPLEVQLDRLFVCETDVAEVFRSRFPSPCDYHTFRMHTGEEKGLFATLVLQIPTEDGYEGGGLVVHYRNYTKTFDCHLVSSVGFCYTVFFADCKQEWLKIKSGSRVCLTFNLFRQDSSVQALHQDFVTCKAREAEAALQPWLTNVMKGKSDTYSLKLAIPLSHKYGKDELFFGELKGDDSIVLEVLKNCKDENGMQLLDLHLCLVTHVKCRELLWRRRSFSYGQSDEDDGDGYCDRHHGDGDEDIYYDSDGDFGYYRPTDGEKICSARSVFKEPKIVFWTGEENKLTMAFGDVGLDKREIVVGEKQECYEERDKTAFYEKLNRRWPGGGTHCNGSWYKAVLIVWPRELSISVFCEMKVSHALDLLELTAKSTEPEFCEHLLRILCWCETNAFRVWGKDRKYDGVTPRLLQLCRSARDFRVWREACNSDLLSPPLFQLCSRANQWPDVLRHLFKLLAEPHQYPSVSRYSRQNSCNDSEGAFHIGIRNMKVAKEVAAVIQVYRWAMCSSLILELVKECALLQGKYFVRLAKELFLIGIRDGGAVVAETTIEVFEARITELQQRTEPVFTWCQPQAKASHPIIEKFLKGPQEISLLDEFENFENTYKFFDKYLCDARSDKFFTAKLFTADNGRDFIELQKKRLHFEIAMEGWKRNPEELLSLTTELREIRSAVKRAEAVSMTTIPNVAGQRDARRERVKSVEDTL